jgi:hypothetical protein
MQDSSRRFRRLLGTSFALSLACYAASCGGGGGGGTDSASLVLSVLQDLDADADGVVTVVTFDAAAPLELAAENFEASGSQSPLSVDISGDTATVTWDASVGTASDVRVVGMTDIDTSFVEVTTSNATAPTFDIQDATQAADYADDSFEVHFSGPRVIEAEAEDPDSWELLIDGEPVALDSGTFTLDVPTQVLSVTLGGGAGLHPTFELRAAALHSVADVELDSDAVPGTAAGDAVVPTLLSAEQNLTEDEFGRVIDFTFSEAMDPFFSVELSDYIVGFPIFALAIAQPSPDVVRVTYNAPIVPGFATVTFGDLVDAHGNEFAGGTTPVTSDPVTQDYTDDTALVTVENVGGDYLTITTDWALVEASAEDDTSWIVEVGGNPVDISGETLTYDLLSKTLTITLPGDYDNGDSFYVEGAGVYNIDGNTYSGSTTGTIGGDAEVASVVSITQNRGIDADGLTYDILYSEQLDETEAENVANFATSSGATVTAAVLQGDALTVRVTTDALVLPGVETFDVLSSEDLAGNSADPELALAVLSTDVVEPIPSAQVAYAEEGSNNDTLTVEFSDDMVESEVEDPSSWSFQSPIGIAVDTSLANVVYDSGARTAVLTFDGADGINLQTRTDFLMAFSGMHDIGGNLVVSDALYGVVNAESNTPRLVSVWQPTGSSNLLHVRFSEEVSEADDVTGLTSYTVRDSGGVAQGSVPSVTLDSDGMGAELAFGISITPGSDTLDVMGVLDLAGNALFPTLTTTIEMEDTNEPQPASGSVVSVSGEDNDQLTIVFDRAMHPLGMTDPDYFRLEVWNPGFTSLDFDGARFTFDGDRTVTIDFDSVGALSLDVNGTYQLATDGAGLQSAQGVPETASYTPGAQLPTGDATAPDFSALRVMLDAQDSALSVIMDLDEAIHADDAVDAALVDIGGTHPDTLEPLGPRSVRATFSGGVTAGQTINFSVRDLAGNLGAASAAIQTADASQPLLTAVQALAVSGSGADELRFSFDEPLLSGPALDLANYTATEAGNVLDLSGSTVRYVSATNTVRILLPDGTNLTDGASITLTAGGLYDLSGNSMTLAGGLTTNVAGDAAAPDAAQAFVNYRADSGGLVVDFQFDEEVVESQVEDLANWSASGGQTIVSVETLRADLYRITLSAPLGVSETLTVSGITDHAGNALGGGVLDPTD